MLLLVTVTGSAGFLCSWMLLRVGLGTMWLRYLVAMLAAYTLFIGLLWLWLQWQRRRLQPRDLTDLLDVIPSASPQARVPFEGLGGHFQGGGASSSFQSQAPLRVAALSPSPSSASSSAFEASPDLDEDTLLVALAAVVVAAVVATVWIVATAPTLLAELFVDGVLVTGLYRRLAHGGDRHWLLTALKRTLLPFAAVLLTLTLAAWFFQRQVPAAESIGAVWAHYLRQPSRPGG